MGEAFDPDNDEEEEERARARLEKNRAKARFNRRVSFDSCLISVRCCLRLFASCQGCRRSWCNLFAGMPELHVSHAFPSRLQSTD